MAMASCATAARTMGRWLPRWARPRRAGIGLIAATWLGLAAAPFAALPAVADVLPPVDALKQKLALEPQTVEVIEPHLSTPDRRTRLRYVGWPAAVVLDRLFAAGWKDAGMVIEFRALDGYVSRVPVERFARYSAYLVFARADGAPFEVENVAQNEKHVALGPYYLVWDNVRDAELLKDGASFWPYQVNEMRAVAASLRALLPGDLGSRFAAEAQLTEKLCLSCHQVNGLGGEKFPTNLAQRAKDMSWAEFRRQVLTPRAVNAQSTMPPLLANDPAATRDAMARRLYDYLHAVPVIQP